MVSAHRRRTRGMTSQMPPSRLGICCCARVVRLLQPLKRCSADKQLISSRSQHQQAAACLSVKAAGSTFLLTADDLLILMQLMCSFRTVGSQPQIHLGPAAGSDDRGMHRASQLVH